MLSEESRRLRFLGPLSTLNPAQLDYLTTIDHVDHVAWGALDLTHPDRPGFGVSRFIRLKEGGDVAEFSLTVLDTVQGHGLGSLLLAVLYVIAPTVGIHVLRGVVARDNTKMTQWLPRLGAQIIADEGSELIYDIPVADTPEHLPDSARLFREHALEIRAQLREQSPSDQSQNEA